MRVKEIAKKVFIKALVRKKNVKFGKATSISINSQFEGNNRIGENTHFIGKLGFASYIGSGCVISATIGRYCSLGNNIRTIRGNHPTQNWVSTHPSFFSIRKQAGFSFVLEQKYEEITYFDEQLKTSVGIGNDVWIGDNAMILEGVQIGDGAIIAAGALVTKNVEPYTIVGGVPAKVIKRRFTNEEIVFLLKLRWWNKDFKWIEDHASAFSNLKILMERIKNEDESM